MRKLEVERTQTNASHHSTAAVASNFNELILLDSFQRAADARSERNKPYQNGQDCCVAFGEDFGPTPVQGR